MIKETQTNYSSQTMDEIVFERRNKSYGAFFLRSLYQKNLLKAFMIAAGMFILTTVSPTIARHLGFFDKEMVPMDTLDIILQQPPSANPLQPAAPPPPPSQDMPSQADAFVEMQPTDEKVPKDTALPTKEDLSKKGDKPLRDTSGQTGNTSKQLAGGQPGTAKIWRLNQVQQIPQFMGGEEAYFRFMEANKKYPRKEEDEGIEGVTWVSVVVNEDGTISNIGISKSSGNKNLDEEAVRLFTIQSRWIPAMQNGHPVRVSMVIPITFRL